MSNSNKTPGKF